MPNQPLPRNFFDRDVIDVAVALLGKSLVRKTDRRSLVGRIVETEAYLARDDAACHSSRGQTRRNASMFGPPGHAYVYPIHAKYCFNIVTQAVNVPSAVLVRAIEPVNGIERMRRHRGDVADREIGSGPAKLCQALSIDRRFDGWDLTVGKALWTAGDDFVLPADKVGRSVRIGVTSSCELKLRFYIRDNPFVSGPKRMRI